MGWWVCLKIPCGMNKFALRVKDATWRVHALTMSTDITKWYNPFIFIFDSCTDYWIIIIITVAQQRGIVAPVNGIYWQIISKLYCKIGKVNFKLYLGSSGSHSSVIVKLYIKFLGCYTRNWLSIRSAATCPLPCIRILGMLPTVLPADVVVATHLTPHTHPRTPSLLSTMAALTSPTLLVVQSWDNENIYLCMCANRGGEERLPLMPECFRIKNYTNK